MNNADKMFSIMFCTKYAFDKCIIQCYCSCSPFLLAVQALEFSYLDDLHQVPTMFSYPTIHLILLTVKLSVVLKKKEVLEAVHYLANRMQITYSGLFGLPQFDFTLPF